MRSRHLTELEMESIILSLYEETEQQALAIKDLHRQLAESKAKILVLQQQVQAI